MIHSASGLFADQIRILDLAELPSHIWIKLHERESVQRRLRLSLIDSCNLRCFFCHNEGQGPVRRSASTHLSHAELELLIRVAALEGVRRVKLTGGEPLLYETADGDLPRLVARLAGVCAGERSLDLSVTTNGVLLSRQARRLKAAGLNRATISVSSLEERTFRDLIGAGRHSLKRVAAGVEAAVDAGLTPVKLNVPIYQSRRSGQGNLRELSAIVDFASARGVSEVRLYTMLWHESFSDFFEYYHFFSPEMRSELLKVLHGQGTPDPAETVEVLAALGVLMAGFSYPKVEYGVDLGSVRLGFEAMKYQRVPRSVAGQEGPYAIRVGADGGLRTTLYGAPDFRLLEAIRSQADLATLRAIYRMLMEEMP